MERIQQLDSAKKYVAQIGKDAFFNAILILYLVGCYYLNAGFMGERNPECLMRTALANAMFGEIVLGASLLIRVAFLVGFAYMRLAGKPIPLIAEFVRKGVIFVEIGELIIKLVGWTTFFYWSQVLWSDISSSQSCTEGRNLWDMVNWIFILGVTVWPAILVTLALLIACCCLPCIITGIKDLRAASAAERKQKLGVLDGMIKKKYNEEDFAQSKECAICFCEYGPDDDVSPLPCKHYFHSECINNWIKENPTCPMCREPITAEKLEAFAKTLEQRMANDS